MLGKEDRIVRAVVESSLKLRYLLVVGAVVLLAVGAVRLRDMPVDVLPEFAPTTVEVQTEALGLSAAEVAELITVPMEQDLLNGVAFLDDIRSESVPGLSRVFLTFEPGTDLFQARQVVAERMTQAHALPHVSKPPVMLQPLSSTNRVMIIGVSSSTVSPIEMSEHARWTIVPRLVGVSGVANVSVWGFRDRQLQIQVEPEMLRTKNVSLLQVVEAAGNSLWYSPLTFVEASSPGVGGFIDTPNQRLGIQHLSPISTADDLAKITLQDDDGTAENLRLGDVATVVEDHQPLIGDAVVNGKGDGNLLLVVEKLPEANVLDVTRGVESAVAAMQPGFSGLEFDTTVYRPASFIDRAIGNLGVALLIGAALVLLMLTAFLFQWRAVVVALLAIPLSLVSAALVLWALGTGMNAIILAGFAAALVLVIDDAVTGVENVTRRLRDRDREGNAPSRAMIVRDATLEVRTPALYAMVIIALAVLPVFFLDELAGSFFPDAAGAYLLALLVSMAVGLVVTPALALVLLREPAREPRESPVAGWLRRGYDGALSRLVHAPRVVYVAAGTAAVAAGVAIPFLGQSLLPTFKEEQLLIRWDGPSGTSLPEMSRITARASRELHSVPGVREVGAHVGRAVSSDVSAAVNSAELWVSIDPSADHDATVAAIQNVVGGYPGLSGTFETFSNDRATDVLGRSDKDVVVRVYGEDADVLLTQARRIEGAMEGVDGTVGTGIELPVQEPTLEIEVDLAAAQARGIKPGDVRRAAATLLGGIVVGNLFERQKVFDVVVWGTPGTRSNATSIRQLLIDTPGGGHVRLGEVADVRIAPNPSVVERQAVSRYLDVSANVSGRDRGDVVADLKDRLVGIQFPTEYHIEVLAAGGQPLGRLLGLGFAAALGILLVLQACFGSWRLAAVAFLALPVAATGGVLAALAAGGTISLGSFIGLAAVFGLAVRSSILLIDRYRELRSADGQPFGTELVLRGARDRFLPTVTTAASAAGAMLPFVVAGSIAGFELVQPVAVVVLGGLVTSTLLTLFAMPALYLRFAAAVEREAAGAPDSSYILVPSEPSS
jgi:Cu/Ag efflux pump CusA